MRNGDFRRLWFSTSISSLGTWLLIVAVPVHVHALTGSATATGLAIAIEAAPALLIGPLAGVLVDRWDRRLTMACASLACAAGVSLIFIGGLAFIYLGLLAESAAAVFLVPAGRALLPDIIGIGPGLASANALSSITAAVIRMTGPILGMLVYVHGGLSWVISLDVASYVLAAALIIMISRVASQRSQAARHLRQELVTGLRCVVSQPLTRGLLLASWIFWTANAGLTALLVPFIVAKLGGSGADVGYLISALGIGYLIGSLILKPFLVIPTKLSLTFACAATGVCFLALFNAPSMTVALVAILASGIPGSMVSVIVQHTLQANIPSTLLGRTIAAFYTSDACAAVVGALLAATLSGIVGQAFLLNLFSAAALFAGLPALAWQQRTVEVPRPP